MSDAALIYLEADDEITGVVRRVWGADAQRVVVVAPGRSRATSSVVALRLLARSGAEVGREVAVVGDALTRSLAFDAGLRAYASVAEARDAGLAGVSEGAPKQEPEPQHAAIHVVRGRGAGSLEASETFETTTVEAPPPRPSTTRAGDETRPIATPQRPTREPSFAAPGRRPSRALAAVLGVGAALLVIGVVAGATLLPAATITVTPLSVPVEAGYELVVPDPDRREGTVEATATVTATGSYDVAEPARGSVVLLNWTFAPVDVPAGTYVAAGEQAFATQADVTVPRGRLTAEGTIAAGEQAVEVEAAAPGPAGNVDAGAIDTFVDAGIDARLRGFPENPEPRVVNPEPTAGGLEGTGPEITEADVERATEALRAELRRRAAAARPDDDDRLAVDATVAEPSLDVPDDLVGQRDVAEAEISGSLAWATVRVDPEPLMEEAARRLETDPAVPSDHELLPETVRVELDEPVLDGDRVTVRASARASAAALVDHASIVDRVAGLPEVEAELALSELGTADVALWPGWVETVPDFTWRVDVRIGEPLP